MNSDRTKKYVCGCQYIYIYIYIYNLSLYVITENKYTLK